MSEVQADLITALGALRVQREGAETPIEIPASGVLTISVDDGASVTVGDAGENRIVGIIYLDANGDEMPTDLPDFADVKFFRASLGASVTVLHNRTTDLLGNPLPTHQRIFTTSQKDFALESINSQVFFAYTAALTDFRWVFTDRLNYDASTPADWDTAPPANIPDALDRLAAAVAGLLGEPIP
jgi:hypothetical protein